MRTIERFEPPGCLKRQPANQQWYGFMQTQCCNEVHQQLRREQKGLCCYCEVTIVDGRGHIEHMEPRSRNSTRTYDYSNFALSCDGGMIEHCGHFKDNSRRNRDYAWDRDRFVSPHDPEVSTFFQYLTDGSVVPTNVDFNRATYMVGYLGLNCARLTKRRLDHARNIVDTLGPEPDHSLVEWLRKEYLEDDEHGELQQFCSLSKQILEP